MQSMFTVTAMKKNPSDEINMEPEPCERPAAF